MKVIGLPAQRLIDYLSAYVKEGGYRADGESGKVLEMIFSDEGFVTWVNAYEEFIPGFSDNLRTMPMDLSCPVVDEVGSIFREGLLSAASASELSMFQTRLEHALALPFEEYLDLALEHLPEETEIDADIYITLDPFNGGMMRPGKVFLSIFMADPTPEQCRSFAHEFHHMGAEYWLEKNTQLRALRDSHAHGRLLAEVFTYFVTEGLANYYTSPDAISVIESMDGVGLDSALGESIAAHNEVVRRLERETPQLLRRIEHLLSWICNRHQPIEEVREAFTTLSIDKSGAGLPPGHFLSGHMVRAMDESALVPRERIISLVKQPFDFFDLYNVAAEKEARLDASLIKHLDVTVQQWSS